MENGVYFVSLTVEIDHRCYILTEDENLIINKSSVKKTDGYIFFDYEAMQTSSGHQVNLVCARKICINCCNNEYCKIKLCGDFVWKTNEEFCEWLFSKENSNYTALAHNMKGYDGFFNFKLFSFKYNS